jgi:hypothetical protein
MAHLTRNQVALNPVIRTAASHRSAATRDLPGPSAGSGSRRRTTQDTPSRRGRPFKIVQRRVPGRGAGLRWGRYQLFMGGDRWWS